MGGVIDAIADAFADAIDAVVDVVQTVWDDVVAPALEEIFSWFGIVDETVVITNKTSVLLYGDETSDVVQDANTQAVIAMVKNGGSFFPWYMKYTRQTEAQVKSFYRFAERERNIYGLPDMDIKGTSVDQGAIDTALDTDIGVPCTRLDSRVLYTPPEIYYKNLWQSTPYFYRPGVNKLTFTDSYGVSWDDWRWTSILYLPGTDEYEITIRRDTLVADFWIEGQDHVPEGETASYTVYSTRPVPVGETVDINLVYGGTAPGTDYTAVPTVTMLAGTSSIDFDIVTNGNVASDGSRTVSVTIDSIDNGLGVFEEVAIHATDSVETTITDDEGIILTMPSVIVEESAGSVTIPVTLHTATAGAFTVDFSTNNNTAIGGIDFDDAGGTLNFTGADQEVQNIVIAIYTSDGDDDNEDFTVSLSNCSDGTVNISQTSKVTISDGTGDPLVRELTVYDTVTEAGFIPVRTLIVEYHENTEPASDWYYWLYDVDSGVYPGISPELSLMSNLDMLPIGILRKDKVNVADTPTTDIYKATKRLMSNIFQDIDDVTDSIMQNPGIADVDDAFINFAVSPFTNVEIVSKVIYLGYYEIVVTHLVTSNTNEYSASFLEQDIQSAVVWTDHNYTAGISGTLASNQEYEHEIEEIPEIVVWNPDTEENEITQEAGSILHLRHQTGPGLYDEIKVYNLNGMASVEYNGYHKMALNRVNEESFTIPLSYFILSKLDPIEQMKLYRYALRIDLYSIQIIELAWYETSAFLDLFQVVAIVVTIWTAGAAGGLWAIVQQLVINYLIIELVIYLAEVTGNAELAAIVGFAAMIALGGVGGVPPFDFASAEGIINASTAFADNLTTGYNTLGENIQEEMREINKTAEERLEAIKEAGEALESPITADFLVALQSVNTTVYPAIQAQFDYDILYNYDRVVKDFYDMNLMIGVV